MSLPWASRSASTSPRIRPGLGAAAREQRDNAVSSERIRFVTQGVSTREESDERSPRQQWPWPSPSPSRPRSGTPCPRRGPRESGPRPDRDRGPPLRDQPCATARPSTRAARPADRARVNPLTGVARRRARNAAARRGRPGRQPGGRGRTAQPGLVFKGTSNPAGCGSCIPPTRPATSAPTTTSSRSNATKVAIYDKSGTLLDAGLDLSSLSPPGPAARGRRRPAGRLGRARQPSVLSRFTSTNQICFAVSQTADPTGSSFAYSFTAPVPRLLQGRVWPTAMRRTDENAYTAYALDRARDARR